MSLPALSRRTTLVAAACGAIAAVMMLLAVYNAGLHRRSVTLSRFQTAFHRLDAARYRALTARSESALRQAELHIDEAHLLARSAPGGLSDSLQRHVAAFERAFGDLAAAYRSRGIDEASGIEGAFRRKAHAIEAAVASEPQAKIALLEMRRSEKDYIMRRHPRYIARVRVYADSLRASVDPGSHLDTLTAIYVSGFESLASSFDAIDRAEARLSATEQAVNRFVAAEIRQGETKSTRVVAGLLVVLSVGIVGAFSAARFLRATVFLPMRRLGRFASKLGSGEAPAALSPMAFRETDVIRASLERSSEHVAAQRAAESKARTSALFLRSIMQSMAGALIVVDRQGCIRLVNPRMADHVGLSPEMLIGRPAAHVFDPEDEHWQNTLDRVLQGGVVDLGDRSSIHRGTGDMIWFTGTASPIFDDDGVVQYAVYSLSDLTDRKRAEIALAQANEEAEGMARLKSALLDNLSHELRTPLSAIIGYSELLLLEAEGDHLEFAQAIHDSGEHQLALLTSLLNYSQAVAGRFSSLEHSVDAAVPVLEAADSLRDAACAKGLLLQLDTSSPLFVRSDESMLREITRQLTDNAIKFTDAGTITVRLRRHADGQRAVLEVEDTGYGIAAEFQAHLFDDFVQQSVGLQRTHGGLGLGLALVNRYVDHLGGTIAVASEVGAGTVITVTIPLDVLAI